MSDRDPRDDPRTRLLAETFAQDWENGPAADFAHRAAAHARRRRMRRALLPATSLALAAFAVAWFVRHSAPATPSVSMQVAPPESSHAQKTSPTFEIISDAELEATLRDRPVLILPRDSDRPRIVLLER